MKSRDLSDMYYNAAPSIFEKAKKLRENMTEAEALLWLRLNKNQLGVRFKPQHPISTFIVDFYCHKHKLVVEIDGEIHDLQKEYDSGRTAELERFGITVIRFTNEEVVRDIENVISKIETYLQPKD